MPKAHTSGSTASTSGTTPAMPTIANATPARGEPGHKGRGRDDLHGDDRGRGRGRDDAAGDDRGGDRGGDHSHGHDSTASFTFSSDNQSVTAMTVTSPKGTRSLDLTESTFKTTVGTNDKGVTAVTQVVQTRTEDDEVETSRYSDQDGDGVFTETFELEVRTTTPTSTHRGTQHQFTFNADGTIASDTLVLATGETRVDAIETGEKYLRTTIDGRTYVVKTVAKGTEYHFEFFRDDNGDGKWTEVAEGHGDASAIDAASQMVSLVGLTPLLQAANAVVG